ncbi:MAG: hypothetical protein GXX83_03605 [Gaiellales bacterium]|nr:hypothetical protein [Gaiellales bacterium]
MVGCPAYAAAPFKWLVTRGRVSLLQDVVEECINADDTGVLEAAFGTMRAWRASGGGGADRRVEDGLPVLYLSEFLDQAYAAGNGAGPSRGLPRLASTAPRRYANKMGSGRICRPNLRYVQ